MRLLIATPEHSPHQGGGIAKFYRTLAPALVRAGCEVTAMIPLWKPRLRVGMPSVRERHRARTDDPAVRSVGL